MSNSCTVCNIFYIISKRKAKVYILPFSSFKILKILFVNTMLDVHNKKLFRDENVSEYMCILLHLGEVYLLSALENIEWCCNKTFFLFVCYLHSNSIAFILLQWNLLYSFFSHFSQKDFQEIYFRDNLVQSFFSFWT